MDFEKGIQSRFEERGFQTDWVWTNRDSLFLLAWKGRELWVVFLDLRGRLKGQDSEYVRDLFLELLRFLRPLAHWDRTFKGREVSFHWVLLIEPDPEERRHLKGAGSGAFCFYVNEKEAWLLKGVSLSFLG